ncbi:MULTISPECIES: LPD11 domain-containing protein [Pseudobacillus]|uniref:LPD11 domain-containing protein n=1 Tax=Pseudobacillus TaxID=108525 RepID=UPI00387A1793
MTGYESILQSDKKFRYQMLSRLKSDCEYYLGYGGRGKKALWAEDEKEQIEIMKALWESFAESDKPEWLTWDDILDYEVKMIE